MNHAYRVRGNFVIAKSDEHSMFPLINH